MLVVVGWWLIRLVAVAGSLGVRAWWSVVDGCLWLVVTWWLVAAGGWLLVIGH